jgi:hypothetical protein
LAFNRTKHVSNQIGSVAVAVGDPALEQVVFVGLLQGYGDGHDDPDDIEDRIRDGVHEMFEEWPEQ